MLAKVFMHKDDTFPVYNIGTPLKTSKPSAMLAVQGAFIKLSNEIYISIDQSETLHHFYYICVMKRRASERIDQDWAQ